MKGYKGIIIVQLLFIFVKENLCGVSVEQMNAASQVIRSVCQPKFPNIPNEVLNNINKRELPEDKEVKCYVNCILEMMQAIKKGKYSVEQSFKQASLLLPDELKDEYNRGILLCRGATDDIDNDCEAAYALLKCFQKNIPRFKFP